MGLKVGCQGKEEKIGVLLAQLGTPDEPTPKALRRYLKQFLSDPRVVESNRALWWVILNGIILNTRPKRSAALYKRVWTENGSPLLRITDAQTKGVRSALRERVNGIEVEFGMRYGSPSIEMATDRLIEQGCDRILLVPMYPQYSAATSASTYDAFFSHIIKRRFVPTVRVVTPYFRDPRYIGALASIINGALKILPQPPEVLLLSYHGIPQDYVRKGDPYCCHCTETTQALSSLLSHPGVEIRQSYQSRFGKKPWLQPYTDETLVSLAKSGVKRVAVACPGFTSDCLETIDEIGHEGKILFEEHGGETLSLIPCLNDEDVWIGALTEIVFDELRSWVQNWSASSGEGRGVECPVQWIGGAPAQCHRTQSCGASHCTHQEQKVVAG